MLEIHMKLSVSELGFPGKYFLLQKSGKWTENRAFLISWKIY